MKKNENAKLEEVQSILKREQPSRFVYAPNYWQWFAHHKNHNTIPEEIKHCEKQLFLPKLWAVLYLLYSSESLNSILSIYKEKSANV